MPSSVLGCQIVKAFHPKRNMLVVDQISLLLCREKNAHQRNSQEEGLEMGYYRILTYKILTKNM
jgi:hypothetical protein